MILNKNILYINKEELKKEESKINDENKKNKKFESKKKKKYTRRFKILRYCLNQLKYNGISLDLFKFIFSILFLKDY